MGITFIYLAIIIQTNYHKEVIVMARRHVEVTPMMVVKKKVKKDLGGGRLGTRQVRKVTNTVRSQRLAQHQACVASKMAGKSFSNLGAVQDAFREATKACKGGQ